jgi:hypothetical protein
VSVASVEKKKAVRGMHGLNGGDVRNGCQRPRIRALITAYFAGAEGSASMVYKARPQSAVAVEHTCAGATRSDAASAWSGRTASRSVSQRAVGTASLASRRAAL